MTAAHEAPHDSRRLQHASRPEARWTTCVSPRGTCIVDTLPLALVSFLWLRKRLGETTAGSQTDRIRRPDASPPPLTTCIRELPTVLLRAQKSIIVISLVVFLREVTSNV